MGTCWLVPTYTSDECMIRFGGLHPGIYCEDMQTLAALRRGAWERGPEMTYGIDGSAYLNGTAVYVATPEQAEFFRVFASEEAPPPPDPNLLADFTAKVEGLLKLIDAGKPLELSRSQPAHIKRRVVTIGGRQDQEPASPNRKARRAAAARWRNRQ